jgi:hypothetical protein
MTKPSTWESFLYVISAEKSPKLSHRTQDPYISGALSQLLAQMERLTMCLGSS